MSAPIEETRCTALLNCYLVCSLFKPKDCFQSAFVESSSLSLHVYTGWESFLELMLKSLQDCGTFIVKASLKIHPKVFLPTLSEMITHQLSSSFWNPQYNLSEDILSINKI